jgi:hypothetical protein
MSEAPHSCRTASLLRRQADEKWSHDDCPLHYSDSPHAGKAGSKVSYSILRLMRAFPRGQLSDHRHYWNAVHLSRRRSKRHAEASSSARCKRPASTVRHMLSAGHPKPGRDPGSTAGGPSSWLPVCRKPTQLLANPHVFHRDRHPPRAASQIVHKEFPVTRARKDNNLLALREPLLHLRNHSFRPVLTVADTHQVQCLLVGGDYLFRIDQAMFCGKDEPTAGPCLDERTGLFEPFRHVKVLGLRVPRLLLANARNQVKCGHPSTPVPSKLPEIGLRPRFRLGG